MTKEEQMKVMDIHPQQFGLRKRCFAGFTYGYLQRNTIGDTPEEREASLKVSGACRLRFVAPGV